MEVGIVGAGIAGLYAALLLKQQGHTVTVFEASSRIGGRIYSHHFKPVAKGEDPFFEAGAMRLPLSSFHSCVFDFVKYLNKHNRNEEEIEFIPYILQHDNNKVYVRGKVWRADDTSLAATMGLPRRFHNKTARQMLLEVMQPWIDLLREDFERGFTEILRYDEMTFRHYLRTVALWPHDVIDFVELIMSQTNQYDQSFTDLMMQTLHFNTPDWVTVKGGLSRIIDSAANVLGQDKILRNSPVREIRETAEGKIELAAGDINPKRRTFDKVILAVPPASIQNIQTRPQWSPLKERAIMASHEGPLYKMGVHFRTRFWEQIPEPCFGGQTQTDLRVRWIVYPSNDPGSSQSGCLIVYSGMTDALRWSWMAREQRVKLVLEDLDNFFSKQGVNIYDQFIDAFDVNWPSEVGGGNTMYLPGQFSKFHEALKQPEGNVFFAGEHISRHHTWVAGAVESAHYAVEQVLGQQTRPLGFSRPYSTAPVELGIEAARGVFIDFGPTIDTPSRSPDIDDITFDAAIRVQPSPEPPLSVADSDPSAGIFVPRAVQQIQVQ